MAGGARGQADGQQRHGCPGGVQEIVAGLTRRLRRCPWRPLRWYHQRTRLATKTS